MDSQTPRANFCNKMNVQKKIQLKIPTLRKIIAAPSGGETKFEKKSLGANSGMFIGTLGENTVSPLSTYVLLKQGFHLKP